MTKRILSILLALSMLFSAVLCFAEDLDDDDYDFDDDDDMESFDDSGYEEEDVKADFKSVSTYNITTYREKDFMYKKSDDGQFAILTSYVGEEADIVFPSVVEDNIPVVRIDDGMCSDNPVIEHITIPGSIKEIGNAAFSRCPNLKSVVIEEGLYQIGMCSFGGCPELTEIQLPDSLTKVDNCGFALCSGLTEVTFGSKLTIIGAQAFFGCANLAKITMPGGDQVTIGDRVFEQCPEDIEIIKTDL
jgi:hypothetical protein